MFTEIKKKVEAVNSIGLGIMPRQEYMHQGVFMEERFLDDRERRIAQQLSTEVHEDENKWLRYTFETSQVKIDVTDMILEDLIHEICLIVNNIPGSSESMYKALPQEILDLFASRVIDPNKPPENTLFT